jgi:hypothetical protein
MSPYCKFDDSVSDHKFINRDVNARFSGISQDQLDKAVMNINGVRAACLMFIGPDTVLVGHGYVKSVSKH